MAVAREMMFMKGISMDDKTKELIALGASVAANCHPCVTFHINKAKSLGLDRDTICQALDMGKQVRQGAAKQMDKHLEEIL